MNERVLGRRFTLTYIEPGPLNEKSETLQKRVAAYLHHNHWRESEEFVAKLQVELGASFSNRQTFTDAVTSYVCESSNLQFLDIITVIGDHLHAADNKKGYGSNSFGKWIEFCRRAFSEENFAFEIDDAGGVHPRVDAKFQELISSAILDLSKPRYASAKKHFEEAHDAFSGASPNTNRSIREICLAVEDVFKLIAPQERRIGPSELERFARSLDSLYRGDELDAIKLALKAGGQFVNACHQYRHAPGTEEPASASVELTVLMLSHGSALLRFLVAVDQRGHGLA